MRVEDRVNRAVARQDGDGFHQRIGSASRSSVDQHDAAGAGLSDDIGFPGDTQDEQILAQSQGGGALGQRLR
jgi:hypothetical protein